MQWTKEKQIVGYFFGSYDTTFQTTALSVSKEECLKTVSQPYMCGNNKLNHDNGIYSFEQNPDGEGKWMSTVKYQTQNCVSMKIAVTRDCETCPIRSPFGILTKDPNANVAIHGQTTYVWNKLEPTAKEENACHYVHTHTSIGKLYTPAEGRLGKLRDTVRQLEYFVEPVAPECRSFNKTTAYAIKGIPGSIIEIEKLTTRQKRDLPIYDLPTDEKATAIYRIKAVSSGLCFRINSGGNAFYGECEVQGPDSEKPMYAMWMQRLFLNKFWCIAVHRNGTIFTGKAYHSTPEQDCTILGYDSETKMIKLFAPHSSKENCLTIEGGIRANECDSKDDRQQWNLEYKLHKLNKGLWKKRIEEEYQEYARTVRRRLIIMNKIFKVPTDEQPAEATGDVPTSVSTGSTSPTGTLPATNSAESSSNKTGSQIGNGTPPDVTSANVAEDLSPSASLHSTSTMPNTQKDQSQGTPQRELSAAAQETEEKQEGSNDQLPEAPISHTSTSTSPTSSTTFPVILNTTSSTSTTSTSTTTPTTSTRPTTTTSTTTTASSIATPIKTKGIIEHLQTKRSTEASRSGVRSPARKVISDDEDLQAEIIESKEVTREAESDQRRVEQLRKKEEPRQQEIVPTTTEQTVTEKITPLQGDLTGYNLEDVLKIFKAKHEQYIVGLMSDHESTLAQEIKQIYCSTVRDRKLNLVAMAQTNGLLAASILFPTRLCTKLTGMGQVILLQQCKAETVTLTYKETRCGIEPIFDNDNNPPLTLARDGMSAYPFAECYWPNGIINVDGKPHEFRNGSWVPRKPTIHFKHLELIDHFPKLKDNSIDYLLNPRQVHENRGIEQANVLAELVARIQQTNANSLDPLVLSESSTSNFWDISGWMSKLKVILFSVIGIIGTAIIIAVTIKILPITKIKALINQRKEIAIDMVENVELVPKNNVSALQPREPIHEHEQTVYVKGIGLLWTKCLCMAVPIAPEHLGHEGNV